MSFETRKKATASRLDITGSPDIYCLRNTAVPKKNARVVQEMVALLSGLLQEIRFPC
ncbi:MAG: hypothetical protein JRI33_03265 [Deltaproteobacteria bacterium]|nr:hypothetical protein [Deltaproteobacteria bacterium]